MTANSLSWGRAIALRNLETKINSLFLLEVIYTVSIPNTEPERRGYPMDRDALVTVTDLSSAAEGFLFFIDVSICINRYSTEFHSRGILFFLAIF